MNHVPRPWRAPDARARFPKGGAQALRLLLAFLLLGGLLAAPARAAVSCSATMTNVDFGLLDLINSTGTPNASATLNYSCSSDQPLHFSSVKLCFNAGSGAESAGSTNPRLMKNSAGNALGFQLYQSPSGALVWGHKAQGGSPLEIALTVGGSAWGGQNTVSGSVMVQARLVAGQNGVPAGNYQDAFNGSHTAIFMASTTGFLFLMMPSPPPDCGAVGSGSFPFTARAVVMGSCEVDASALNFGAAAGTPGTVNIDAQSGVNVTCSNGTAYSVALTPSNGANNGAGLLRPTGLVPGNADEVPYRLYSDAGRANAWGSVIGNNTVAATGTGAVRAFTVYGRVPGVNFTPDSYLDTVTVTVNY